MYCMYCDSSVWHKKYNPVLNLKDSAHPKARDETEQLLLTIELGLHELAKYSDREGHEFSEWGL